jgi:hypothetical protein
VPDLERAFAQADQTPAVRRRILRILLDIGGADALAMLADTLESPERAIRRRAIELLAGAGYRASAAQGSLVERSIESLVRDMVWDMNVRMALGDSQDFTAVRDALEAELAEARRWLFDLLSLICDPGAIASVRDIIGSGSAQGMVHALEILELLLPPVLKPFVFPVLEGQTHQAVVRKLETLVPREHFTPYEALRALVRRDYGRIGVWTRAVALDTLGRVADGVTADLVAFLFHPDPMIREIAAVRVVALDPNAWATHRRRLSFDVRQSLESVIGVGDVHGEAEARSIFGRTLLLRKVAALSTLAPEDLIALAGSAEVRVVQPGQELPSPRDPEHAFFVTVHDDLVLRVDGGAPLALPRFALFTVEPGAARAESQTEAILIRVDPTPVFELAGDEPQIIPGLLNACETLNRYAHA